MASDGNLFPVKQELQFEKENTTGYSAKVRLHFDAGVTTLFCIYGKSGSVRNFYREKVLLFGITEVK